MIHSVICHHVISTAPAGMSRIIINSRKPVPKFKSCSVFSANNPTEWCEQRHYDVSAAAMAGMIFGVAARHGWMNVAETLVYVKGWGNRVLTSSSLRVVITASIIFLGLFTLETVSFPNEPANCTVIQTQSQSIRPFAQIEIIDMIEMAN